MNDFDDERFPTVGEMYPELRDPGPIGIDDIPVLPTPFYVQGDQRAYRVPEVDRFLAIGTAMTVDDVVRSREAGQAWLHHDGSISRGNADSFVEGADREARSALDQDSNNYPVSRHAGSALITLQPDARIRVEYADGLTEQQKATLERLDAAARGNEGVVSIEHFEGFAAWTNRAWLRELAAEERAMRLDRLEGREQAAEADRPAAPPGWFRREIVSRMARLFRPAQHDMPEADRESVVRAVAGAEHRGAPAKQHDRPAGQPALAEAVFRVTGDRSRRPAKARGRDRDRDL